MPHHNPYRALKVRIIAFLDDLVKVMALFKRGPDRPVDCVVVAQMKVVARNDGSALHGRGIAKAAHFFDDQLFMADHVFEKGFAEKVRDAGHELIRKLFVDIVYFVGLYRGAWSVFLDIVIKTPLFFVFFDARKHSQTVFPSHDTPPA